MTIACRQKQYELLSQLIIEVRRLLWLVDFVFVQDQNINKVFLTLLLHNIIIIIIIIIVVVIKPQACQQNSLLVEGMGCYQSLLLTHVQHTPVPAICRTADLQTLQTNGIFLVDWYKGRLVGSQAYLHRGNAFSEYFDGFLVNNVV